MFLGAPVPGVHTVSVDYLAMLYVTKKYVMYYVFLTKKVTASTYHEQLAMPVACFSQEHAHVVITEGEITEFGC